MKYAKVLNVECVAMIYCIASKRYKRGVNRFDSSDTLALS